VLPAEIIVIFLLLYPVYTEQQLKGNRSMSNFSNEPCILVERNHSKILELRIHRPLAKNALNQQVREELKYQFNNLDPQIRCVVLKGGDDFAAGADIKDMAERTPRDLMIKNSESFWKAISDCPVPIIAAVRGLALGGGCELAMHADIIVAGESAKFGQPEVKLGIMPGAGGTQRLMRAIGKYQAMKMLLTGKLIGAADAKTMGLVSDVTTDAECETLAFDYANTIAGLPALAVRQIKEVALAGQDLALDAALKLERKAFQLLFDTHDQKEGMKAFLEKRKPNYEDNVF